MSKARFTMTALAVLFLGMWGVADQQPPPAPVGAQAGAPQGRGQGGRGGRGGPPRVRTRKVVLAWADTRNGIAQHDSVSHALAVIERLGYESGAYDTYIRTDSNIVANEPKMTTGQPASGGPSAFRVRGDRRAECGHVRRYGNRISRDIWLAVQTRFPPALTCPPSTRGRSAHVCGRADTRPVARM